MQGHLLHPREVVGAHLHQQHHEEHDDQRHERRDEELVLREGAHGQRAREGKFGMQGIIENGPEADEAEVCIARAAQGGAGAQ